ncbi:hypothetical protein [Blastococcus brunescens]|uniref:Uncharacterized protein n=1 Tax=Blastococcus brunescens TaxID=1564165 RepID=A0ABZ1B0J8_9ACTN|nr:hypothetical protein [Blastococcus sp. BMG 8361]WRL64335.1 hypothetical protein U6N30_00235 [Blastococcus sp. BMG 8361]
MHDDKGNPFLTVSGSTLEVLAGTWDNLADAGRFNSTTGPAIYDVTDSRVSVVIPGVYRSAAVTGQWVSDVVNGTRVGSVTSSEVVVGRAFRDFTRATLPLYVSPDHRRPGRRNAPAGPACPTRDLSHWLAAGGPQDLTGGPQQDLDVPHIDQFSM